MPNIKYDYSLPEEAFVFAPDTYPATTLKKVSERFSIPYQTLRAHAAANKWTRKRLNYIIPLRLEQAIKTEKNPNVRASLVEDLNIYKAQENTRY